jgi:N-acetylneuraminic acid mutarotase
LNNRIYVFGGSESENQLALQSFVANDPLSDTWDSKTPLPIMAGRPASCGLDQLIYLSGGIDMDHEDYDEFYVYNPICDAATNS